MMKQKIIWITQTGVMTAMLICAQFFTAGLGNPLVTGSLVNLILVVTVMVCGLTSGLSVAMLSPMLAKLFGIGPFWTLIPFIMLGNAVLVCLWRLIGKRMIVKPGVSWVIAAVVAAGAKCLTLYAGVVKIAIPFFLDLNEKQTAVLSATFSLSQLYTALVGGAVAIAVLPLLNRALGRREAGTAE